MKPFLIASVLGLALCQSLPAQARRHVRWQPVIVYPAQLPKNGVWHHVRFDATVLHANGHDQLRVLGLDGIKYTIHARYPLNGWSVGQRLRIVGLSRNRDVRCSRIFRVK